MLPVITLKGGMVRITWSTLNFGAPVISLERLKLELLNFGHMYTVSNPSLRMTKPPIKVAWSGSHHPFLISMPAIISRKSWKESSQILYAGRIYPNWHGQGHVTYFLNFNPIISLELVKLGSSNFVYRLIAFDAVIHTPLFDKLLMLNVMPDEVYNGMRDYFQWHSHCTKFDSHVSPFLDIHASVFQGSALGPASYVITAAYLRTRYHENKLLKYADDTYLIVPAVVSHTVEEELNHIAEWSQANNLRLNQVRLLYCCRPRPPGVVSAALQATGLLWRWHSVSSWTIPTCRWDTLWTCAER